ncbi:MAG TPA: biotin carboxylase N-terminal domain-containing protein [Mycobacteriales bacterium]|nr:biotin carboxylase N-terminal domain-containing protein [Mycobacteriales bacterium]
MPPVTRVLVANRGEIARRVFRTCREMGIGTVAVFSDADADLPHVREADVAVRLPGSAPAETYLRADLLVDAARRTGADAVHPGYGFLSEDAAFARAVVDAGLTWIGPPPDAVEAMGSKLGAKALMEKAGVPVLPGVDVTGAPPDDVAALAERIGYPVLVKASAGGGGRGMRVVRDPAELADAVASAQREAEQAFGDGTVFLERYVDRPRHVEVQVMADAHGDVVALFERDCSIQRRHQKVVEEAPSPAVDDALRTRLCEAAVAAARAVGYTGAGTVEFVVSPDGEPAFLEMNTRLQVEHPVTELVTGLDLVRLQLLVAMGRPLPREVHQARLSGHAIEVRLYAENPTAGFLPATGVLHRFEVPDGDGVRVDAGVESGSVVGTHYDAMLAKVLAHGATREEASLRLADALARARLHGVTTNRDLLVRVLRSRAWLDADVDTAFLDRHDPAELGRPLADDDAVRLHAAAAALAGAAARRRHAQPDVPWGWRSVPSAPQRVRFGVEGRDVEVAYAFGRSGLTVDVDGTSIGAVALHGATADAVDLEVDGVRRRFDVSAVGSSWFVDSALGATELVEHDRYPEPGSGLSAGSLVAPMPGTVVRVAAQAGAGVAAGEVLLVLEAMKMEHAVRAPADGTVDQVHVSAGQQVDAGALLVVLGDPAQDS